MASSFTISAEAVPPWVELPREVTASILQKLGAVEILTTAQKVCTTWRRVCRDPSMWRCIQIPNSGDSGALLDLDRMCRNAVDLSQGDLTDITIERNCSDDLLLYISQRSNQLRRLQLVNSKVTAAGLSEAVKCFPLLEELLLHKSDISVEAIENLGLYCPLLRSFKLNDCPNFDIMQILFPWRTESDLQALAIAQNMPQLRHLQLIGNSMTSEGLQAILDGCLNLESLDLRKCTNVRLVGDLRSFCLQWVKDLRLPEDSMDDYPFAEPKNVIQFLGFTDAELKARVEMFADTSGEAADYEFDWEDFR